MTLEKIKDEIYQPLEISQIYIYIYILIIQGKR